MGTIMKAAPDEVGRGGRNRRLPLIDAPFGTLIAKDKELRKLRGEYLKNLGRCLVEARQYDEAEKVPEKALALSPDDAFARNNLQDLRRLRKLSLKAGKRR